MKKYKIIFRFKNGDEFGYVRTFVDGVEDPVTYLEKWFEYCEDKDYVRIYADKFFIFSKENFLFAYMEEITK